MAAKGYFEAHKRVIQLIREALTSGLHPGESLKKNFAQWHLALFSPSVTAGILKPADLAGYRNSQVFIRNALHVPLAPTAVRDCMPVLLELIANEEHAGVRAVLGHFFFVFIHPYMDGNGRLGRFLMNYLLVAGGYVWTIVTVESRSEYLAALEQASTYGNIEPFADLIVRLVVEQTVTPVERRSQREAND
jgi:Fic family protein